MIKITNSRNYLSIGISVRTTKLVISISDSHQNCSIGNRQKSAMFQTNNGYFVF